MSERTKLFWAVLLAALAFSFTVPAAGASDPSMRCTQAFLAFKGYDPGTIDGAAGKKTRAAAAAYKKDAGLDVEDLSPGTAQTWCALAKSDEDYAQLLQFSYNVAPLSRDNSGAKDDLDQVLLGDSVGEFEPAERNVQNPAALGFVELNGGIEAARIEVDYTDKGHPADWNYNDRPGKQQRFELTERRSFSMQPGKTYWLRMSVFIPEGTNAGDRLSLTDLKPMVDGILMDPVVALVIQRLEGTADRDASPEFLQLHHLVGRKQDCVVGANNDGADTMQCDKSEEHDFIVPISELAGKWLNVVYRVTWANDESGRFHLWLNDKLVAGLAGNTLHGAEFVTNKFGVYRGYHFTQGTPQPDVSMYFAGVGRSETCAGLGLSNCDALEADAARIESPGVVRKNVAYVTDMSDYLAAGGRLKYGTGKRAASAPVLPGIHVAEVGTERSGRDLDVNTYFAGTTDGAELGFLMLGEFDFPLHTFKQLELLLTEDLGATLPPALLKCPGQRTETWGNNTTHVAIRLRTSGNNFTAVGADCIIAALPKKAALQAQFLLSKFHEIAASMVTDGTIDQISHDGVKIFMQRVASGQIAIESSAPEMAAPLPEPKFVIQTQEDWVRETGKAVSIASLLNSSIKGGKKGENRLYFKVSGDYNYPGDGFLNLAIVIQEPVGKTVPDGLAACPGAKTEFYEDVHHVVIRLKKQGEDWVAQGADCIIANIPAKPAFMAKFLLANFRDVAIGLVSSGGVEALENDGLRTFMQKVAEGKIVVR